MKKSKIKQLSVMLSLLILSQNDINPEELDNILREISEFNYYANTNK